MSQEQSLDFLKELQDGKLIRVLRQYLGLSHCFA